MYDGIVGEFLLIFGKPVLVEGRFGGHPHCAGLNYLRATGLPACLLINFKPRIQIRDSSHRLAPPLRSKENPVYLFISGESVCPKLS
jgi:hypothetical protein